ncbi:MAG: restriction endonuclease subunit S [Psychrobacillus psychrodurans]
MNVPKLRFSEFKGHWTEERLDNLGSLERGKSKHRPRNDFKLYGVEYPFIQTRDVKKAGIYLTESEQFYSEFGLNQSKLWGKGTLCITIAATIAETTILDIEACFPDSIIGFTPTKDKSSVIFIKLYFDYIKSYLSKMSEGVAQDNMNLEKLRKLIVKIPSLDEQQKISSFLVLLDQHIGQQQKKVELLKLQKKGFMQKIFSQELRFKDENGKLFTKWRKYSLKQVMTEFNQKTKENNEFPVISSTSKGVMLQSEYFNRQIASEDNTGYKILKKYQVVLSPQNLWLGNINYNSKYDIGIVSPSYKIFEINEQFDKSFIAYALVIPKMFYNYKISSEQGASIVRRNLNLDMFYEINCSIPCFEEQKKISSFFEEFDKKINYEEDKLNNLIAQKQAFMQQMFI